MNTLFILLPEFTLIIIGWGLSRFTGFKRPIWESVEKLVYFFLFPCLLISSTSKAVIDWRQNLNMLLVIMTCMVMAGALGYAAKWFIHKDPIKIASGIQTTFRFNTYIALAAAGRLSGDEGIAIMAIIVACMVPFANVMAVLSLAKHSETHILKELSRNPFIVATLGGLCLNVLGIQLPDIVQSTITRLGSTSIPLGLMTVGAGLAWGLSKRDVLLVSYWTSIKLMVLPAMVLLIGKFVELPTQQLQGALLLASMPTATTSYVLAIRMGGHGGIVSVTVSLMTLLAALTIPFWISML